MDMVREKMSGVITALIPYQGMAQTILYVIGGLFIAYIVYTIVFPSPDPLEQLVINNNLDASQFSASGKKIELTPPMASGGDYTFQTWMYINNYDYRAGQPKHVFTINSSTAGTATRKPHETMVGILYPSENKMMIRVNHDGAKNTESEPDLTLTENLTNMFSGNISASMFQSTVTYPLCDIQNLPLQKWINLAIVVQGRVVDVYVDGKLSRSCLCPGVPIVEAGKNYITFGKVHGWSGNISTTRFTGFALTPAEVYTAYTAGPEVKRGLSQRFGFLGFLGERIGIQYK